MEKEQIRKEVYFSVADRQMENFLDDDAFERSLILNILFQPGIYIPDIFFFISHDLERHVLTPEKSFFEVCIENGLVTPSFRDFRYTTFPDALYKIRGEGDSEQAIQGVLESAERLAVRLQRAVDASKKFSYDLWPHDIGERFDKFFEEHVASPNPPQVDESSGVSQKDFDTIWRITERWRLGCVDDAREASLKLRGESGLRRGDLMNAVARNVGLPEDHKIDDIKEILEHHNLKSPEEVQALKTFFRWMCECYQYNQALEFGTRPNFPGYDPQFSEPVMSGILPEGPPVVDMSSFPTIRETVPFPQIKVLQQISPTKLLEVREDKGYAYRLALDSWLAQPNATNENEVRRYLRQYSKEIRVK